MKLIVDAGAAAAVPTKAALVAVANDPGLLDAVVRAELARRLRWLWATRPKPGERYRAERIGHIAHLRRWVSIARTQMSDGDVMRALFGRAS